MARHKAVPAKTDGYGYLVLPHNTSEGAWYVQHRIALERANELARKSPGHRIMICQATDTLVAQVQEPTRTKLR